MNWKKTIAVAAALGALPMGSVDAQLANASASTLALAGNHTALARGFGAISVNPAGLGMPGSGFSLALIPVQGRAGLAPISLSDLSDFGGRVVPAPTKEEWLTRVANAGGETGSAGADATWLALTTGNFGIQLSTVASGDVNLPTGIVEAMLFGNAGRTGSATDLSLTDASIESFAVSTAGVSYAFSVTPLLVVGATGKYHRGHAMAVGRSTSGSFGTDPVQATLDFAMVSSCADEIGCAQDFANGGSGLGLDLGAMLDLGELKLGLALPNVVNTFSWDTETLGYRPGTLLIEDGEAESDFDEQAYENAPDDLKAAVDDFTFKPGYRLGAALDVSPMLTLTADVHGEFSDEGLQIGPDYRTGFGAELRAGFVHLRAGLAKISDGLQYGGGFSLVLGPLNLSLAGGLEQGDMRDAAMGQFVLSFGNR